MLFAAVSKPAPVSLALAPHALFCLKPDAMRMVFLRVFARYAPSAASEAASFVAGGDFLLAYMPARSGSPSAFLPDRVQKVLWRQLPRDAGAVLHRFSEIHGPYGERSQLRALSQFPGFR